MNTDTLFRKYVFAQVFMGLVTFCIAAGDPVMLLIAGSMTALSWYVVEGPSGTPLPRWLINLGCMLVVAWLFLSIDLGNPDERNLIVSMGRFTLWIQILMLYTRKQNRDYILILVLSLMQVLSASILSISIVFGLLLGAYVIVALGTALQFHLKIASDTVMEATAAAAPRDVLVGRPEATVGRGHRWQFRLNALIVGVICVIISVLTFITIPRLSTPSRARQIAGALGTSFVGFSDSIRLDSTPINMGNEQPVLHVSIQSNDPKFHPEGRIWLLRGACLDQYSAAKRTWVRSNYPQPVDKVTRVPESGIDLFEIPELTSTIEANITMLDKSQTTVFTIYPVTHLKFDRRLRVRIGLRDQAVKMSSRLNDTYQYTIGSYWSRTGNPSVPSTPQANPYNYPYATGWDVEKDRIRSLTLDILSEADLDRDTSQPYSSNDPAIISTLCQYLRQGYEYTLSGESTDPDIDPIVDFLFNHKSGHCELFASALAAMTRSIGMRTRVITGLLASEYNIVGGYYVARQSNAHAWVEIDMGQGYWQTYDPTPPADRMREHQPHRTWYSGFLDMYDHIQFTWTKSIAGFDHNTQKSIIQKTVGKFRAIVNDRNHAIGQVIHWFKGLRQLTQLNLASLVTIIVVVIAIGIGLVQLARILIKRKKRIEALKLQNVSSVQRRTMVRSLRFYLQMLEMLDSHGHVRPPSMTPRQFAEFLNRQYENRFQSVAVLTELFYEIRFGHRPIDVERSQEISLQFSNLQRALVK